MGIERAAVYRRDDIGQRLGEKRGPSLPRRCGSRQIFHDAEAEQHAAVFGNGGAAVVRSQKLHGGVVAAAANRPVLSVNHIQAPFLHVAVHVVEAPGIGGELRHLQAHRHFVAGVLLHLPLVFGEGFSCVVFRGGAGAARVFPFGFGGETEGAARLAGEPRAVGIGLLPAYHDDGFVIGLGEALIAAVGFVRRLEGLVLGVGDFGRAHAEGRVRDIGHRGYRHLGTGHGETEERKNVFQIDKCFSGCSLMVTKIRIF